MQPLTEKEKREIRWQLKRQSLIAERRNQERRNRFMRHDPRPLIGVSDDAEGRG